MEFKTLTCALVTTLALNGCGGGGNSDTTTSNTHLNNNEPSITVIDQAFSSNQSVELMLYFPGQSVTDIVWQQTAGANVEILSPHSKVIAFTPNTSGEFTFQASFTLDGQQQTLTHSINVDSSQNQLVTRLGHAVNELNKISLRVEPHPNISTSSIRWVQTSGPTLDLGDSNGALVIYPNAPQVSKDQIATIEVNASDNNGNNYTDTVSVLIEDKPAIANNAYFDETVATVLPYNSNSPYASNLVNCVYSNALSSSCTLNTLPLLAQDTLSPTVNDIMDRVVVSHPWMGQRFKEFLEQHDRHGDFKRLLRATTAVVISYDIRPAFYWAATGAIYLDPDFLWLTPEERDTINEAPDFRSSFGEDLQFEMIWRYVKDNDYGSENFTYSQRSTRTQQDILFDMGYLLYHELAHANDFLPPSGWANLNSSERLLDEALKQDTQSDILSIVHPLASQELKDLAQVRFQGSNSTATQRSYQPNDIEQFFEPDRAVYFYSYTSTREDYAMLFEELMMQHRYGLSRDIAITNNPPSGASGEDFIVSWGQRGRLSEPQIEDRLAFTVARVLPEFEAGLAINNLPAVIPLNSGNSWVDNLNLTGEKRSSLAKQLLQKSTANRKIQTGTSYYQKPLPKH